MADEDKLRCWICSDKEYCDYSVCYETEITERIKQEEEAQIDMFDEGEE